jgi:hypothetical protein
MDIATLGVKVDGKQAVSELDKIGKGLAGVGNAAAKSLPKLDKNATKASKSATKLGAAAKKSRGGLASMSGSLLNVADGAGVMEGKFGRLVNRTRSFIGGLSGLRNSMTGLAGTASATSAGVGALGNSAVGASAGMTALGASTTAAAIPLVAILGTIGLIIVALAALAAGAAVAFAAVGGLYKAFKAGLPVAAQLEEARLQLGFMMGDMDAAEKRMGELIQFSNETPFSPTEVIGASKLLYAAGGEDFDSNENLKLIGAASKIANRPLEEVTSTFGRLYASLAMGKPDGEALRRLMVEIPVLSQNAGAEIRKLSAAGASQADVWKIVTKDLGKYSEMLMASSMTWNGLISTIDGKWKYLLSEFAKPIMNALKPVLVEIQQLIDELLPYAQATGEAIGNAIKALYMTGKQDGLKGMIDYARLGLAAAAEFFGKELYILGGAAMDTLAVFMIRRLKDVVLSFWGTFGDGFMPVRSWLESMFKQLALNFVKHIVNEMASKLPAWMGGGGFIKMEIDETPLDNLRKNLEKTLQIGEEGAKPLGQVFMEQAGERRDSFNQTNPQQQPFGGIPEAGGGMWGAFEASPPQTAMGQFKSKTDELAGQFNAQYEKPIEGLVPQEKQEPTKPEDKKKKDTEEQISQVEGLLKAWGDVDAQIDELAANSMVALRDTMVDVITGAKDAKEAFAQLAEQIVKGILKIIMQLLIEMAVRAAIRAISGGAPQPGAPSTPASTRHSGGAAEGGSTRSLPTAAFAGVKRYHKGGIASSEIPAVLEKGEMVLSRKQRRDMEGMLESNAPTQNQQQAPQQEMRIVNVIDPREVQREIANNPGLILNVISRNRKKFQQAFQG